MNVLPSFRILATEVRSPRALRAYLFLLEDLDTIHFRPVKVAWVCRALRMSRPGVRVALRQLVRLGALERGPKEETGVHTYRVMVKPLEEARGGGIKTAPPQAA